MDLKIKILPLLSIVLISVFLNLAPVFADTESATPPSAAKESKAFLGEIGQKAGYREPVRSPEEVVGGIIQSALALSGVIFLALTVYGGYLWMLAREDEAQAKKALQIIKMAVIGLVIILAAYAITFFILVRLTRVTG